MKTEEEEYKETITTMKKNKTTTKRKMIEKSALFYFHWAALSWSTAARQTPFSVIRAVSALIVISSIK